MAIQARIRGNNNKNGAQANQAPVNRHENLSAAITQQPISKPTTPAVNVNTDIGNFVQECKASYVKKALTSKSVAVMVTSKIRYIYFSTCIKHEDKFDIETFNYMDKILFDHLSDILEGYIKYGGISASLIKTFVQNTIDAVEYEVDINQIFKVIDDVFAAFAQ